MHKIYLLIVAVAVFSSLASCGKSEEKKDGSALSNFKKMPLPDPKDYKNQNKHF